MRRRGSGVREEPLWCLLGNTVARRSNFRICDASSRAPFVRHSLKTDDLAKARSRRDILEKADFELWAAMLLKGGVVNRVDFAIEFLMFQKKATV